MSDVDFSSLRSASGAASAVPRLIERLRSQERERRVRALVALYQELYREGFPYPAAVPAVPLLASLAADVAVLDRHRIVIFLHDLAKRAPSYARHGLGAEAPRGDEDPLFTEVSEALRGEGSRLEALLDDTDARVRTAAAWVIAYLAHPPIERRARVLARLSTEADPRARASLVLCLGHLGRRLDTAASDVPVVNALRGASAPTLVRGAAAVSSAWLGAPLDEPLLRDLGAALNLPRERGEVLRANQTSGLFPWGQGSLAVYTAEVLALLGARAPAPLARVLMGALSARLDEGQPRVVEADRTGDAVSPEEVF